MFDRVPRDGGADAPPERRLATVRGGWCPPGRRTGRSGPGSSTPASRRWPRSRPSAAPSPTALPAPGRRLLRVVSPPDAATTDARRQAASSSRSTSTPRRRRAGHGRDLRVLARPADADPDDPAAFLWTVAVITTAAEDELGHIHDRMPMFVEPGRYDEWLDPRRPRSARRSPAGAGGARPARGLPGVDAVNNVRNNGPELVEPLAPDDEPPVGTLTSRDAGVRTSATAACRTALGGARSQPPRRWRWCSVTAPAGASDTADLLALAGLCPSHGIAVFRIEQPWVVAGRRVAPRARAARRGTIAVRWTRSGYARRSWSAAAAPARGRLPTGPPMGAVGCLALAFPLHPPGRPESSRRRSCRRRPADAGRPGRARRVRHARTSSRRSTDWWWCRRPTTASP